MIVILSLLFLLASVFSPDLLTWIQQMSESFHQICLNQTPVQTKYPEIYQAMVCGKNLPQNLEFKFYLTQTSLIHLIVVSGSHLLFLSQILKFILQKLHRPHWADCIIGFILFLYLLCTAWQAPAVRAFVSVLLRLISRKKYLFWSSAENNIYSLLICLILFPDWISSLSLLLSTSCALAVSLAEDSQTKKIKSNSLQLNIRKSVWTYCVLVIPLAPICIQSPIGIIYNIIFGPLVGLILFPLCLIANAVPPLYFLTDLFLQAFEFILKLSFRLFSIQSFNSAGMISISIIWLYVFFLHFFSVEIQKRKEFS